MILSRILYQVYFFKVVVLLSSVCGEELSLEQRNMEIMALNRDGFYRENPDGLLAGFFAAWPAMLYIIGS